MGLYHPLGDFATNFPAILHHMHADYAESLNDSENGRRFTPTRWTKSRNAAKRSAKRSSATKKMHLLERNLDFPVIFPDKKKTLVLPVQWQTIGGSISAYVETDIGIFTIEFNHKKLLWQALWDGGKSAYARNPFSALAKLLGQNWYEHKLTGTQLSLYDFYAQIHFDYGQKENIRNRTRKIVIPDEFRKNVHRTPELPKIRVWSPPPNPPKKIRVVFGDDVESEKSRI